MKTIITIQHTQAVHHLNGMVGSWTDWELTDLGKAHAENIGKRLAAELSGKPCKIYASDLIRTKQTAEPLARHLNLPVEYRAELRELNLGVAIGKTRQWMRENGKPIHTIDDRPFPDAESGRDVWNRLSEHSKSKPNGLSSADLRWRMLPTHFMAGFPTLTWLCICVGMPIRMFHRHRNL